MTLFQMPNSNDLMIALGRRVNAHAGLSLLALVAPAILGGLLFGQVLRGGWNAVSVFETCYGVLLAIGIFFWTLSGHLERSQKHRRDGAVRFSELVAEKSYKQADLADWHLAGLAKVFGVRESDVEDELLCWLTENLPDDARGGRAALVIARDMTFMRVSSRGAGGKQIIDLADGQVLVNHW